MNIILIVGPSGSGKDTLLRLAKEHFRGRRDIAFCKRYITRSPDTNEDNFFVEPEAFRLLKRAGYFVSTWKAHGNHYGIPRHFVAQEREVSSVICSISRLAVEDFEFSFSRVTTLLVTANTEVLRSRLLRRGRENPQDIGDRLLRATAPVHARKLVTFDNSQPLERAKDDFITLLGRLCDSRRICHAG